MSEKTLEALKSQFGESVISTSVFRGDATAVVKREKIIEVLGFLKEKENYEQLMDLTVVDYLKYPGGWEGRERFALVYNLYSYEGHRRFRVKVPLPEDNPSVETACVFWRSADWLEREAWDMFGVVFTGHPNLKRLLMYEEFEGHPLRKDYHYLKQQPLVELLPSDEPLPDEMDDEVQHPRKLKRETE
ncbi:MAG: NADH-quinone oxidoreductase subunit C [Myxococcota bacterium]